MFDSLRQRFAEWRFDHERVCLWCDAVKPSLSAPTCGSEECDAALLDAGNRA